MSKTDLKSKFVTAWSEHGFAGSDIVTEHRFHDTRRWRFDVAWPSLKVGVELDGWGFGHQSVGGREADNEKANAAAELGWVVLRYTPSCLSSRRVADTVEQVCRVLEARAKE